MAKLLIVFGTQGAGKSNVVSGVSDIAKVVNMGDEMLSIAALQGVTNRDELRKLHAYSEKSQEWRLKILPKIKAMRGTVVLDTHASIKLADRYTPGLTLRDVEALAGTAKGIVYVDATTEEVMRRRAQDGARARERDNPDEIETHRSINLALASFFSAYLNIPLYIIHNKEGSLREAQERLRAILKELNM
ncbi:MAG: AAA family ATPase [Candidatus Micrarchaeaceae archaeon]